MSPGRIVWAIPVITTSRAIEHNESFAFLAMWLNEFALPQFSVGFCFFLTDRLEALGVGLLRHQFVPELIAALIVTAVPVIVQPVILLPS